MSREFGSYVNGYFHNQIDQGAEDCLHGRDELTRMWGSFLKKFSSIAYSIASSEACDSGEDDTILETIARLPELKAELARIEAHVETYKRVAEAAVRDALEKKRKTKK